MGAILRSAHFLGADGILICTRNTAPLTPVALKAAVGAAETLPLFAVGQSGNFIDTCQENGWKIYAAVSPSSSDSAKVTGRPYYSTTNLGSPTQNHPCILILGSEGEGLRWNIQKKADYLLGIESARTGYGDLDSLNVSVAAALLCDAFLRKPTKTMKAKPALQEVSSGDLAASMEGQGSTLRSPVKRLEVASQHPMLGAFSKDRRSVNSHPPQQFCLQGAAEQNLQLR